MASANPIKSVPDQLAATDLGAGWPQADIAQAVAIELDQSSGNSNEIGWDNNGATVADTTGSTVPSVPWSSYDTGDFQINSSHDPGAAANVADPTWMSDMENPIDNSKEALALFKASGFQPWQSPSGQLYSPQDLAEGQTAAGDVAAATPAQLDSAIGWIWNHFGTFGKNNVPMNAASNATAGAVTGVFAGGWQKTALELGAGLAGATLVILGLYSAAKSPTPKGGGIAKDALAGAAL